MSPARVSPFCRSDRGNGARSFVSSSFLWRGLSFTLEPVFLLPALLPPPQISTSGRQFLPQKSAFLVPHSGKLSVFSLSGKLCFTPQKSLFFPSLFREVISTYLAQRSFSAPWFSVFTKWNLQWAFVTKTDWGVTLCGGGPGEKGGRSPRERVSYPDGFPF